jgi:Secretion system C-terminal sorting domain/Beta-propeller repeat
MRTFTFSHNRTKGLFFLAILFVSIACFSTTLHAQSATYLGGNQIETGWPRVPMTVDQDGNVFVAGFTLSTDFPTTPGAYSRNFTGGSVAFVAKFNSDLSELLACTFIGGNSFDFCYALAVDIEGFVYITGHTPSDDFPTTDGVYGPNYFGDGGYDVGDDIFISKFSNDLSTLVASTFIGGEDWEMATDIEIAPNGDVYITAFTNGTDYPVSDDAFDSDLNGNSSVVITRMDADFTTLISSTYLSTKQADDYPQLAVSSDGLVYVTGTTSDTNFPTTDEAFDTQLDGGLDGYVSCLNSDLSSLIASTFLGGSGGDFGYDLAIDDDGKVFVVGHTVSTDFPAVQEGINPTLGGGPDGFVCRLSSDLSMVEKASYFGGDENDNLMGIVLGGDGALYLSGYSASTDFYTTDGVFDGDFNGVDDGIIIKCDRDLSTLHAATYFGGNAIEHSNVVGVSPNGEVYLCGSTRSTDLPTSDNSYDPTYNGAGDDLWGGDVYVGRLSADLTEISTSIDTRTSLPENFELLHCYPNPFNASTKISFNLNDPSKVKLDIYNLSGQLISSLIENDLIAGNHSISWNANSEPSGIYFCRLESEVNVKTRKILLLK